MSIVVCLSLVFIGILLDAIHNRIRRESEYQAFKDGYNQAMKEVKIKKEAEKNKLLQESFHSPLNNPTYAPTYKPYTPTYQYTPVYKKEEVNRNNHNNRSAVPESFMDDLHANGHAIVRIK